jgi:hypothetical protein
MKRADRKQFHYIYKITRFDGKFYIGLHSTDNLDDGYFGSGKRLWYSINFHGKEKHTKEIIEFLPDRESLRVRESELVNYELLNNVDCLNLMLGGTGGDNWNIKTKEEQELIKNKIRNSLPDITGSNNPMYGKKPSWTDKTRNDNKYLIITPTGEEIICDNIKSFCRNYEIETLNHANLFSVAKGRRTHHKGYKCQII